MHFNHEQLWFIFSGIIHIIEVFVRDIEKHKDTEWEKYALVVSKTYVDNIVLYKLEFVKIFLGISYHRDKDHQYISSFYFVSHLHM